MHKPNLGRYHHSFRHCGATIAHTEERHIMPVHISNPYAHRGAGRGALAQAHAWQRWLLLAMVVFGVMGSSLAQAQTASAAPAKMQLLASSTTSYYGSYAERVNNIARGAAMLNGRIVQPGQVFSFNAVFANSGIKDGFVEGYAIVNGRLAKSVGGGLCQVSTTLYRAVFRAALDLVARRNHSYVINFYENIAGFDATVYAPYTDFKFRNDTRGPIKIVASTNPAKGTVTFSLWGYPDGRKAQMIGPKVSNVVQPGKPMWQFDPALKRGQVRQLVHGRPGMSVSMGRVVTAANGAVLHRDNLPSIYKPWADFYTYGPGVKPPKGVIVVAAGR